MAAGDANLEELKSLVVHTLETNGVLGQIRAQLRANVYKAIDRDDERASSPSGPAKILKSPEGRLMAEIVAEFFEFYQFRHSLSVFVPECNLGRERRSRTEVGLDAGLVRVRSDVSILEQLVGLATGSDLRKDGWHSSAGSTTASSPPPQPTSVASTRPHTSDGLAFRHDMMGTTSPELGETDIDGGLSIADVPVTHQSSQEYGKAEDPLAEEVAIERRKLLGRLPSLANASASASKASSAIEEVSLGEPFEPLHRAALDEEAPRIGLGFGRHDRDTGRKGDTPPSEARGVSEVSGLASVSSSPQGQQTFQRPGPASPATSAAGSHDGSPVHSVATSPRSGVRSAHSEAQEVDEEESYGDSMEGFPEEESEANMSSADKF